MQPTTETLPSDHSASSPLRGLRGHSVPSGHSALSRLQILLLSAILLIAAALRLYNIAWDSGTLPHPDERSTVAFYAPSIRWPDDLRSALDPRRSPLNPFWDVSGEHRRSYTYGHFPLYTLVLTAGAAEQLAPLTGQLGLPDGLVQAMAEARSVPGYTYLGRFLMALADTATVYLVFLLGRRLYGTWAGLLAAAFSAFTVLQIQLAHFFAVDPVSTTFTLLALYGAIRIYDRGRAGAAVLTGVAIGLAVASKFSALPIVAAPLVAARLSVRHANSDEWETARDRALRNLIIAGVVSFVVFAVTSPFVFLDFENFWQAVVKEQGDMVSGVADMPFTRQYRGTPAYLYFIQQQIRWGMGWPLGLLAFAGLAWVLVRALTRRASPGEWILLSWVILYFGPTGLFLAKFMRYMVPVVPLFVLFGAGLVANVKYPWPADQDREISNSKSARRRGDEATGQQDNGAARRRGDEATGQQDDEAARQRGNGATGQQDDEATRQRGNGATGQQDSESASLTHHVAKGTQAPRLTFDVSRLTFHVSRFAPHVTHLKLAIAAIALLGAIIWSLAFVNGVYGTEHSWVTASRWVYENIPTGSCIAQEHWEEGFPRAWAEPGMNPGAHRYRQPLLPMYEEDSRQKFETIRDTLRDCDYLALASNRLWRTIPRLPERYPMSTRYYQALFDGELGFEQVYTWTTPPRLGPLVVDDQAADESFTVYDHPQPIIFKKTRQLSETEWEALLGDQWQGAVHGYVGRPTLLMRLRGHGQRVDNPDPKPQAPSPKPQKSLLLDRPVDELPVVDDYHWNRLANRSALVAVVVWWLAVQVIGWLAWPLSHRLFRRLPDRGYLLSKSLGWLLVGYGVWLASSLRLLPNALPTIIGLLVVLGAIAVWLFTRQRRHRDAAATVEATASGEGLVGDATATGDASLIGDVAATGDTATDDATTVEDASSTGDATAEDDLARSPTARNHNRSHSLLPTPYSLLPSPPSLGLILAGEAVFTLAYLAFVGLRLLNPDLWQPWNGGEKMLEIGFLNAVVKSAHMPPYDPYFAGGYINYYYYGLFLVGVLVKLTGIQPAIAFNLAVPTLAALTAGNVFSLAYNLAYRPASRSWSRSLQHSRALAVGILAVLLVLLVGNLAGFTQLLRMLGEHGGSSFQSGIPGLEAVVHALAGLKSVLLEGTQLPLYNYWDPSRVVPDTINEFPYFSFLFADLHPHMIGIPFTVLFLSLAYTWLRDRERDRDDYATPPSLSPLSLSPFSISLPLSPSSISLPLSLLSVSFCLGALAAINTWDMPTYLGVITLTFWLARYRRSAQGVSGPGLPQVVRLGTHTLEAILFGALTLAVSYLLYLPFFVHYQPLDVGLGLVHDKTELGQFVKIWGLPLFVVISYLLVTLVHPGSRMGALRTVSLFLRRWNVAPHLAKVYGTLVQRTGGGYWAVLWSLVVVAGMAVGLWSLGYRVPGLLLPLVWLSFLFLLRPEPDAGQTFAGLLLFTGLLILLGVEFFFLRDFLGGSPYYRMNTLFKFYIQVWVMLGIAAAYLLVNLWIRSPFRGERGGGLRIALDLVWQGMMMALIAAVLVYPALGTPSRLRDRFDRSPPIGTLDGMAYMTTGTLIWPQDNRIELEYDYDAIRWLQANVKGTPVLAEAKIGYYREGGMRVASYTGLPMPLGGLHQSEQRWPDQVGQRDGLYMAFWNTDDPERVWDLIQELDISYIYIGQLEQTLYNSQLTGSLMQWGVTFFIPDGIHKFDKLVDHGLLAVVYENERTRIYKVAIDR